MRLLLATLTLAAAAAVPAHADTGSAYSGRCGFDSFSQYAVTGDTYTGVTYGYFAVWSPTHGNAVTATVTCQVEVDGVVAPGSVVSGSGTGLVVLGGPVTFTASDTSDVELCWTVDYTSDETPTDHACAQSTNAQFPPQEWIELINWAFWFASPALDAVEAAVCGLTGGDVYLDGELWWDCRPYEYPPNPDPGRLPYGPPPFYDPPYGASGPTGGGYNTGDAGLLVLTTREAAAAYPPVLPSPDAQRVTAACAFATVGDSVHVAGAVVAPRADETSVRCRLLDADDGTVLYDATDPTALRDTIPATGRPITVCTSGSGDGTVVGEHCRPGVPV